MDRSIDVKTRIREELEKKDIEEIQSNNMFKYINYGVIAISLAIASMLIYKKVKK